MALWEAHLVRTFHVNEHRATPPAAETRVPVDILASCEPLSQNSPDSQPSELRKRIDASCVSG